MASRGAGSIGLVVVQWLLGKRAEEPPGAEGGSVVLAFSLAGAAALVSRLGSPCVRYCFSAGGLSGNALGATGG